MFIFSHENVFAPLSFDLVTAVELLHVGDVIKEINGNEVTTPEQLQDIMKKSSGTVTFKIIPTMQEQNASAQVKTIDINITITI